MHRYESMAAFVQIFEFHSTYTSFVIHVSRVNKADHPSHGILPSALKRFPISYYSTCIPQRLEKEKEKKTMPLQVHKTTPFWPFTSCESPPPTQASALSTDYSELVVPNSTPTRYLRPSPTAAAVAAALCDEDDDAETRSAL